MKFGWRFLLISPTPPNKNPTHVSSSPITEISFPFTAECNAIFISKLKTVSSACFCDKFPRLKKLQISNKKNVKFKSYNSSTIAQKVCMLLCVNQNHNFFKAVTWLTSCDVQNCWSKQPTEKNETIIDMSAHNIYICLECPYRSTNVYVV